MRRRKDRPGRLAAVYLVDMNGEAGWDDAWAPGGTLTQVVQVGWVVSQGKLVTVLVTALTDTDTAHKGSGGKVVIPTSTIKRIQWLEEPPVKIDWD